MRVHDITHTDIDCNLEAHLQASHLHLDRIDIRSFVIIRFSNVLHVASRCRFTWTCVKSNRLNKQA
jgi:hypothetical protein